MYRCFLEADQCILYSLTTAGQPLGPQTYGVVSAVTSLSIRRDPSRPGVGEGSVEGCKVPLRHSRRDVGRVRVLT